MRQRNTAITAWSVGVQPGMLTEDDPGTIERGFLRYSLPGTLHMVLDPIY